MTRSKIVMGCRKVRKLFPLLTGNRQVDEVISQERQAAQRHLESCARCAEDYRVYSLSQTVLDLAAAPQTLEPGKDFYVALRARIARGQDNPALARQSLEEPWTSILWLTARQMIPAMALLLLLMIGATLLWSQPTKTEHGPTARIDVSEPTADDVIDSTFIVAEERIQNGK